jgi:uncharacterized membrane protein YgdD (TMEM256/DUF423 family)
MTRFWLAVAGLGGFVSIIAGAISAHTATDPQAAEFLRTGATYGLIHAAALIAVLALAQGREPRRGAAWVAGWSFTLGIVLFSFGLFALAETRIAWFGWATPVGGLCFMVGWASLAILALRRR